MTTIKKEKASEIWLLLKKLFWSLRTKFWATSKYLIIRTSLISFWIHMFAYGCLNATGEY